MRLDLHIEELVLQGNGLDPASVVPAIERGLTELFAAQGIPPTLRISRDVPSVDAGGIEVAPGAGEVTGERIARAVYRGLGR